MQDAMDLDTDDGSNQYDHWSANLAKTVVQQWPKHAAIITITNVTAKDAVIGTTATTITSTTNEAATATFTIIADDSVTDDATAVKSASCDAEERAIPDDMDKEIWRLLNYYALNENHLYINNTPVNAPSGIPSEAIFYRPTMVPKRLNPMAKEFSMPSSSPVIKQQNNGARGPQERNAYPSYKELITCVRYSCRFSASYEYKQQQLQADRCKYHYSKSYLRAGPRPIHASVAALARCRHVYTVPKPHGMGNKQSLKSLASQLLKRQIQHTYGHDSSEDARTAVDLALFKIHRDVRAVQFQKQ